MPSPPLSLERVRGKTVIITGANSGIGAAAARALVAAGANLVITGRSQAVAGLAAELGCDYALADFAELAQVKRLAGELTARYPIIDVLVNNAGAIQNSRQQTVDGFEQTFQVNYLASFLLTRLLQPQLEAHNSVVINTSSIANLRAAIDFDDLQAERSYNGFVAYGRSKLMNILHAQALAEHAPGLQAVAFHPGNVMTGFGREGNWVFKLLWQSPLRHLLLSPEDGADTLLWLIAGRPGQDWQTGGYYYKRKPGRLNAQAGPEAAEKLWQLSLRLTEAWVETGRG